MEKGAEKIVEDKEKMEDLLQDLHKLDQGGIEAGFCLGNINRNVVQYNGSFYF